jgi:hypothetical protein
MEAQEMSDKKLWPMLLGTVAGIALVGAAVAVYVNNHKSNEEINVNDVFERAKQQIKKLDEAVEAIRASAINAE